MMELAHIYIQLFCAFFVIGMFTIGGGYAMLTLIQNQVVSVHGWMSESTFTDIVAISQMTPGPVGVNCATYAGYDVISSAGGGHLLSVLGSGIATFALVLPSFIIVLAMVRFYMSLKDSQRFKDVMNGIRPAVCGLIGSAAVILIVHTSWNGCMPEFSILRENFPEWKSWILFGAALIACFKFKINQMLLIVMGGLAGLLLF